MVICNDNSLSDDEIYSILFHYKDQLKYSWEISKYFSLAHSSPSLASPSTTSLSTTSSTSSSSTISTSPLIELPPLSLLDTIPNSFELAIQKCLYYLEKGQFDELFNTLSTKIYSLTQDLCQSYQINSDLFFDSEISLYALANEIVESYQSLQISNNEYVLKYEVWIESNVELILRNVSVENSERWKKMVPVMSGKRRRIEKVYE